MGRLWDVIAVAAVAIVVLLPKASVDARPALRGDPVELDRVAELQADLLRNPEDVAIATELAGALLSLRRPDWAMATVARFADRGDYRVHLALATAHAERLEPLETVAECRKLEAACAAVERSDHRCPDGALTKGALLRDAMQALVDGKIDPASDPVAARDAVYRALHPATFRLPSPPPAKPSKNTK